MRARKSKMGRPPMPAKERRAERMTVRLQAEEMKKLQAVCKRSGMTIADLVRSCVLTITEREIDALVREKVTT